MRRIDIIDIKVIIIRIYMIWIINLLLSEFIYKKIFLNFVLKINYLNFIIKSFKNVN